MNILRRRELLRVIGCGLGCLGASMPLCAQNNAAVPAPDVPSPAPAPVKGPLTPVYEVYFQPFNIMPLERLRQPRFGEGLLPDIGQLPPLIPPFDPVNTPQKLSPLEMRALTSRVMLPGRRDIASLDVVEGRVGDEVNVRLRTNNVTGANGFRLVFQYDPQVVKPVDADCSHWPVPFQMGTNFDPDDTGYVLLWASDAWMSPDILTVLKFRIVGPGESVLAATTYELSDLQYEMVPTVFRDGLVRAKP